MYIHVNIRLQIILRDMNRPLTEVYSLAAVNKYGANNGWQSETMHRYVLGKYLSIYLNLILRCIDMS